tara:strand:+ start:645 stop:821 length:177 start_codon:yes stop_codon:yes gene_type:complete
MKTVLVLYIILAALGYTISVPPSEREIDMKDCEIWKYDDPEILEWCLDNPTPEIRDME